MLYTKENELINIFMLALQWKSNLLEMKQFINDTFIEQGHPYICSTIQISITDTNQIQYDYYFQNTDGNYEDIVGLHII